MPMLMFLYTGIAGMPGHGVVITTLIFREGYSRLGDLYIHTVWSVSIEMAASRMDVLTFFTTVSYLSKQCVDL